LDAVSGVSGFAGRRVRRIGVSLLPDSILLAPGACRNAHATNRAKRGANAACA
jgi:hypothetical protein